MRQQEIGTTINRSNLTAAAGGGLIFALIDAGVNNSRAKKAETSASSIRDSLIDYKPGDVLAQALKDELAATQVSALEDVQIVQIKDAATIAEKVKANPTKSVVVLDLVYNLLPNFDGSRVVVTASIHPATGRFAGATVTRGKLPPVCYLNTFSSTYAFPVTPGTKPAEAAKMWSSAEGERAKAILTQSLKEVAAMLVYDLDVAAPANNAMYKSPKTVEHRNVEVPSGAAIILRAAVEKTKDDRVWLRCPAGELCAVPR
jgi:hypothetical protein